MDDECVYSLGELIRSSETIEDIVISKNKITDKGMEILSDYLKDKKLLKRLDLNGNKGITDKLVICLLNMLDLSHIDFMDISGTSITQHSEIAIFLEINKVKNGFEKISFEQR